MTTQDLSAFERYLRALDYADQTVEQTLGRAHALLELPTDKPPPAYWRSHLLRMVAAGDALPAELTVRAQAHLDALNALRNRPRGGRKPRRRVYHARSVPDETWTELLRRLSEPAKDPAREGCLAVLELQASSGLRIGDILRIPTKTLLAVPFTARAGELVPVRLELEQKGGGIRLLDTSGAPGAWARLARFIRDAPRAASNVAGAIAMQGVRAVADPQSASDPSSKGCAYGRCRAIMRELAPELGLERLHTHRLRRTVGVQALRLTGDVATVAQLLGQVPGSRATFDYLDEARPERVAELSGQIREKFGGKR